MICEFGSCGMCRHICRFTRYDFVACHKLTTSLRHELFRLNQTYYLLTIVVNDMKNVVGKPYDSRSHRQFDIVEIIYDFSVTRAARTIKIACHNRKQKSYRVNWLYQSSSYATPLNRPLQVSGFRAFRFTGKTVSIILRKRSIHV